MQGRTELFENDETVDEVADIVGGPKSGVHSSVRTLLYREYSEIRSPDIQSPTSDSPLTQQNRDRLAASHSVDPDQKYGCIHEWQAEIGEFGNLEETSG